MGRSSCRCSSSGWFFIWWCFKSVVFSVVGIRGVLVHVVCSSCGYGSGCCCVWVLCVVRLRGVVLDIIVFRMDRSLCV